MKIWHIPEKGLEESLSTPECVFSHKQRRVETVSFHPTADFLLTSTSFATVSLWDINTEAELYCKIKLLNLIKENTSFLLQQARREGTSCSHWIGGVTAQCLPPLVRINKCVFKTPGPTRSLTVPTATKVWRTRELYGLAIPTGSWPLVLML